MPNFNRNWVSHSFPFKAFVVACATTLVSFTLVACSGSSQNSSASGDEPAAVVVSPTSDSPFKGTALSKPFDKPSVVLTDTAGKPYSIAKDTKGKVTVLYVGYTNCPDVCPTTMADVAVAMRSLPKDIRDRTEVVMVTSDPARDTPKRMKQFLGFFDKGFIGLTGKYSDVSEAAHTVGVPISEPTQGPNGSWVVDHGAQVILFGLDDKAREIHTSGFTSADLAHDIKLLAEGKTP